MLVLTEEHTLLICSYSIVEVNRVIRKRFPAKITEWEHFCPRGFPSPYIRDEKDMPILVSAILAQPDVLVTGDYDFHTPEIQEYFAVYTPADFLRTFCA